MSLDKLMSARCKLLTKEPFYGSFAMGLVYHTHDFNGYPEVAKTIAVRMMNSGNIEVLYYPPFVEKLSIDECYGVLMHEIEHVIRLHCIRGHGYNSKIWNIACDMTVNGQKSNPKVGYPGKITGVGEFADRVLPMMDSIVWVPADAQCDLSAEAYYKLLMDNSIKLPSGDLLDNHSVWIDSNMSADEARQIVKNIVDQAIQRNQGKYPGHLAEAINDLAKPKVRWRELLRRYLGMHVGNKRYTFSRRNRRRDDFGIKGVSHRSAAFVNVIVDTSGSIGAKELGQFFAEIDCISSRAVVNVLQWDADFQGYAKYRRGDWKRFTVLGRGGTDMVGPFRWLEEHDKVADVQVMLTDGYCSWSDRINYPCITVITTDQPGPNYGHVVRLDSYGVKNA